MFNRGGSSITFSFNNGSARVFFAGLACVVGLLVVLIVTAPSTHAATCGPTTSFKTTWKTDNPGTSNSTSITIPGTGAGYNYSVDWDNDGIYEQTGITTASVTHDFGVAGTYTVAICGTYPQIFFNNVGDKSKILRVDQWGDNAWREMISAFYGANNLNVTATDAPNLSSATSLHQMFRGAASLVGNSSFNDWGTGTIVSMMSVFADATQFNQPIGGWDTSAVTNMQNAFAGATLFNQDITSWDTGQVATMVSMFGNATAFNQPIGGWDTSNVTIMERIFSGATSFNQSLNDWDVSNVINMRMMFLNATSFNQSIAEWDTSSVTIMHQMFRGATVFNQNISSWDTSQVTTMEGMFELTNEFNQPIGNWDISSVTTLDSMFLFAEAFNQPLNSWDIGNVISLQQMFAGATSFNQPLNNWDVSNVNDMVAVFSGATSFNQPIGEWDTSNVTNMHQLFLGATAFNQPLNNWDVSNVTSMFAMFGAAPTLVLVSSSPTVIYELSPSEQPMSFNQDLSNWDTGSVFEMRYMFADKIELWQQFYQGLYPSFVFNIVNDDASRQHPFSYSLASWDVSSVLSMVGMLSGSSLSTMDYDATLAGWSSQSVQSNVSLGADGLSYCDSETQRQILVATKSWVITGDAKDCTDVDGDGVSDAQENLAPGGDGNGDGIADRLQPTVGTMPNVIVSSGTVTLSLSNPACKLTSLAQIAATGDTDSQYRYPLGLTDFIVNCSTPGATVTVSLYYYSGDQTANTTGWTARKLQGGGYRTIDSANISTAQIAGRTVALLSYQITDGSSLDDDGVANGIIVDPAGPGMPIIPGAPIAGAGKWLHLPSESTPVSGMFTFGSAAVLGVVWVWRQVRRGSKVSYIKR